tara:strand:+ start:873 stop:1355 length:483 start_codon:yes stop_codon:yes gene_type:complete
VKLSENFSLEELIRSSTARRIGLDNIPNDEHLKNLQVVVDEIAQPLRDHFGKPVRINSGYRSPALNAAIGGSKKSQHSKGEALDLEIDGVSNLEVADWITDNCDYDQVILEFYNPAEGPNSGWVHASCKANLSENRERNLIALKDGKKTVYVVTEDFIEE